MGEYWCKKCGGGGAVGGFLFWGWKTCPDCRGRMYASPPRNRPSPPPAPPPPKRHETLIRVAIDPPPR